MPNDTDTARPQTPPPSLAELVDSLNQSVLFLTNEVASLATRIAALEAKATP